jgi:hypothetical protein
MSRRLLLTLTLTVLLAVVAPTRAAWAGGGPENVVLVVDPADPDAMQVANHYIQARGIPASNVLYLAPTAADYPAFTKFQLPALLGTLRQRGLDDHVDYIVTAGRAFYVPAPNLVNSLGCNPVTRFGVSGAWTLAYSADQILGGGLAVSESNRYYANADTPTAFDGRTLWLGGQPSTGASARRYFLGYQLGYSGERGNPVAETLAMIDRSVAADGTRPVGTFYYMRNGDIRSQTRSPYFADAVAKLTALGAKAEIIDGTLPEGRMDAVGVMAGSSDLPIRTGNFALLPGAWGDHLTSFAGTFDGGGQTKMSEWIGKGASGSAGTVEEPCVFGSSSGTRYQEKFPHPRLFTLYYQGLSMGEALFRSTPWAPFHALFYGDPLTRAFAFIPQVAVPDAPTGSVTGVVTLHPQATTASPTAKMAGFGLYVDGLLAASGASGALLTVDTRRLPDGPRDLRVVATDDSAAKVQGAWRGTLEVRNHPERAVDLAVAPVSTAGGPAFHVVVTASGGVAAQVWVQKDTRILAAGTGATLDVTKLLTANSLGIGRVTLVAAARFADGVVVTSRPAVVDVPAREAGAGIVSDMTPVAYGYEADVLPDAPALLDLPALGAAGEVPPREIVTGPAQATLTASGGVYLLQPNAGASGTDAVTFRANDNGVQSAPATIQLHYCGAPAITVQPEDAPVCRGEAATLAVRASGSGLTYQWFKDGQPIPGATGASLTIARVTTADLGTYTVTVSSRCGPRWLEVTSQPAQIAWDDTGLCVPGRVYLPWVERRR